MPTIHQDIGDAELSAIARLFSSAVIRELGRHGRSPTFARLSRLSGLPPKSRCERVGDFMDKAYVELARNGRRTEHVYKTALLHKVLLGKHSLRTATMLTELRVGDCRADVVILNGTSTVYEVKSERDGLRRLAPQLDAYRKVFARVNVIAAPDHVNALLESVPGDVGIMRLTSRGTVSTVREAIDSPQRIEPSVLFDTLRREEAKAILSMNGLAVPNVPNTEAFRVLKTRFVELTPQQAHDGFVTVLRRTRSVARIGEFIDTLPRSLRATALRVRLPKADRVRLVEAMHVKMDTALAWA